MWNAAIVRSFSVGAEAVIGSPVATSGQAQSTVTAVSLRLLARKSFYPSMLRRESAVANRVLCARLPKDKPGPVKFSKTAHNVRMKKQTRQQRLQTPRRRPCRTRTPDSERRIDAAIAEAKRRMITPDAKLLPWYSVDSALGAHRPRPNPLGSRHPLALRNVRALPVPPGAGGAKPVPKRLGFGTVVNARATTPLIIGTVRP